MAYYQRCEKQEDVKTMSERVGDCVSILLWHLLKQANAHAIQNGMR